MAVEKNVYGLDVDVVQGYSKEVIELLESTVNGTPGKIRYKPRNFQKRLELVRGLSFIQIRKGSRVLGTAGVVKKETNTIDTLYYRYLTMFSGVQRPGNSEHQNKKKKKRNLLRTAVGTQLSGFYEQSYVENGKPVCSYAYVEGENFRSRSLCESFGFQVARKFQTLIFSRFFPKLKKNVVKLDKDDYSEFKASAEEFYKNYSFLNTDDLELIGELYVYKVNGEAVAGLRAIPVVWDIVELPGFTGFLMQKILPYLPVFKKVFQPTNLNFIAYDYAWFKDGYEHKVADLMEHACAEKDTYMGMYWGDKESEITRYLIDANRLGFLNKLQPPVSVLLMLRPVNIDDNFYNDLISRPVFISAMDTT